MWVLQQTPLCLPYSTNARPCVEPMQATTCACARRTWRCEWNGGRLKLKNGRSESEAQIERFARIRRSGAVAAAQSLATARSLPSIREYYIRRAGAHRRVEGVLQRKERPKRTKNVHL